MADAKWDTTGLERVLKRLKKLETKEVKWGFFKEDRYSGDNDNLPVAQVAYWQTTGTQKLDGSWHIPPRPFFQTNTLRIHSIGDPVEGRISYYLRSLASAVFKKGYNRQEMNNLGKALQESLQQEILDWGPNPPNAKYTKELKGHDTVLIETGKMYDSVKYKVVNKVSAESE